MVVSLACGAMYRRSIRFLWQFLAALVRVRIPVRPALCSRTQLTETKKATRS